MHWDFSWAMFIEANRMLSGALGSGFGVSWMCSSDHWSALSCAHGLSLFGIYAYLPSQGYEFG